MNRPWMQLWTRRWLDNKELRRCDAVSRAVLVDLMCLAHEGEPYGFLADKMGPLTTEYMSSRCMMPAPKFRKAVEELTRCGFIVGLQINMEGTALPGPLRGGRPCDIRRLSNLKVAGYISRSMRRAVFTRDGFACVKCRSTDRLTIDHRHPVSKQGKTEISNLQTMCMSCNVRKGNRIG